MQFIDTHAHLYLENFRTDKDEVINRARNKGIRKIILPNIDSASLEPMHQMAKDYPDMCVPLVGLHPTHVKENFREELEIIFRSTEGYAYKAVGEIGIDLYWDKTYLEQQIKTFEFQLNFAVEHKLPVVIHARESFPEIIDIVSRSEYRNLRGIFHAFSGNQTLAKQIIGMGYLLGIGGVLTFKNSKLSEVIRNIDLDHLVLETDSPFLAPTPFRGKRNESSYVYLVAEKLAEIKGVPLEKVAEITTINAKNLFLI